MKAIREQRKKAVKRIIKMTLSFRGIFPPKSFTFTVYIKLSCKMQNFHMINSAEWVEVRLKPHSSHNEMRKTKKSIPNEWPIVWMTVLKYHNNINDKNCSHNCVIGRKHCVLCMLLAIHIFAVNHYFHSTQCVIFTVRKMKNVNFFHVKSPFDRLFLCVFFKCNSLNRLYLREGISAPFPAITRTATSLWHTVTGHITCYVLTKHSFIVAQFSKFCFFSFHFIQYKTFKLPIFSKSIFKWKSSFSL